MDIEKDFNYQEIQLKDDYEGKVTATLISSNLNTEKRIPILYIHGFIDYFFQPHLAEEFHKQGYDFFALELRKYGHSLLSHQHPNYCKSVEEYFEEISFAIKSIYDICQKKILLIGHSTGGLTTSLYMNKGKERELVCGLILNSPFLELNMPLAARIVIPGISKIASVVNPFSKLNNVMSSVYGQSIHKNSFGEWDYNLKWKPLKGYPVFFAWLLAIVDAQKQIKQNSLIKVPILVMFSSTSINPKKYNSEAQIADTVLNVKHISEIGQKLGDKVTLKIIKDGMHDLFLSKKEVRSIVFKEVFSWILVNEINLKINT